MRPPTHDIHAADDLAAARRHDEVAFERLIAPHLAGLRAHCYRMLGSPFDADDALQETLLRAWRALPRFTGASSLRTWLHAIATNVCLTQIERRPKRVLALEHGAPADPHGELDAPLAETTWVEPFPHDGLDGELASPEARYEQRESVELAFVAALQHLPDRQRAVLLLRDVLGFAPAEIATALQTTPAAVYSTLQRARQAAEERLPERSQQQTLQALGDRRLRALVRRYVDAWDRGDVGAIAALLTADATLAMPPRPTWFRGRDTLAAFLAARPLAGRRWRFVPVRANAQPAFGLYCADGAGTRYEGVGIQLLTLDAGGSIADMTSFHRTELLGRFGLPDEIGEER